MREYVNALKANAIKWMELALVSLDIGVNIVVSLVPLDCMDRAVAGDVVSARDCSHVLLLMVDVLRVNQAGMEQGVIKHVPMASMEKTVLIHAHFARTDIPVTTSTGNAPTAILAG